jgi:uncharacterized protein
MSDRSDRPLTEREIEDLDALLASLPSPYDPMDVAMLDGFLAGVVLQPEPVPFTEWRPLVYHGEGSVEPDNETSQRIDAYVLRRLREIEASLAADEPFDPIVFEVGDDQGQALTGRAAIAALEPWALGFASALEAFPGLDAAAYKSDDLGEALALILRHLPLDPEASGEERAAYAREQQALADEVPLADLDDALDLVVGSVLRIDEIVHPRRPHLRDTPKVGRNDPCPCGSGKKFKACHGREPVA